MHPEFERLQRDFHWNVPLSCTEISPNWYRTHDESPVESAYIDQLVVDRAAIDRHSWWYRTRNRLIVKFLRQERVATIWDVGSGTGIVATALVEHGWSVIGVEPSLAGARITADLGIPTFQSNLEALCLPGDSVDAVSLFDVLEHVNDRSHLISEIHRVLKPGGFLVVTVPALPALWSQFDVLERHFLRYTKSKLRGEFDSYGFETTRLGYMFLLTVLPLFLLRALPFRLGIRQWLSHSKGISANGGWIGVAAEKFEEILAPHAPLGSSIIAVAKKRKTGTQSRA